MAFSRINPFSKANPDTGFGTQPGRIGGRFVNKDGSYNLKKVGWPFLKRVSVYSYLLELAWPRFLGIIFLSYIFLNLIYTGIYLAVGTDQLQGMIAKNTWGRIREVFYFSTQAFTTVGYGRINPVGDGADCVASVETMTGWLFFSLVTGMFYGRFTRPKAFIAFSEKALISPFRQGRGLMFRMVPYKTNHHLTDVKVVVNISFMVREGENTEYKFYQLDLERSRIDSFNMNWTVVHPIDQDSPILHFLESDLEPSDVEMLVQVSGFDPIFSNMVIQRTSYNFSEIVWGARFLPMYHESEDGNTTILELHKLNDFEEVAIEP
jgi:inward rectifier potassium channel